MRPYGKFLAQESCWKCREKTHYLFDRGEMDVLTKGSSRQGTTGMSCVRSQGSVQREIQILFGKAMQCERGGRKKKCL